MSIAGGGALLKPEPKDERGHEGASGLALFGIVFTALALLAICSSTPLGLRQFPDCPVQMLGSCGIR